MGENPDICYSIQITPKGIKKLLKRSNLQISMVNVMSQMMQLNKIARLVIYDFQFDYKLYVLFKLRFDLWFWSDVCTIQLELDDFNNHAQWKVHNCY